MGIILLIVWDKTSRITQVLRSTILLIALALIAIAIVWTINPELMFSSYSVTSTSTSDTTGVVGGFEFITIIPLTIYKKLTGDNKNVKRVRRNN